ncbi:Fis family transcriptional regulator [Cereibacter sphaeroides]|uniref:Fis family transcriptional regulator n=1 Tax=Cereibacter sphaeroides TaxID=1063 RepID=UPI000F536F8F|nr:Fis family transcriptional regulator [Cereibacter sphaeroides]AZB65437.1 Fis family transcriptional regulator [Cereibacter sphaeroides]AZB70182.1 Fis family transcriptional regulator [Cereibacter sphaeroides]
MTMTTEWLTAFPIQPASAAVNALIEGWKELSAHERPHFNHRTNEGDLTKTLKIHVENNVAPRHGLLGMWSAEDVIGDVDPATGERVEERRTDIVYGWNDATQSIKLVFEFKRLGRQKKHRDHYLLEEGLGRFVTGIYSRKQAVAAMVGVLLDPEPDVVPPIRDALKDTVLGTTLRLIPTATGQPISKPSSVFPAADFDTEHIRDAALAPTHGHSIRVSHFFFAFGYPTATVKTKKPAAPNA